MAKTTAVSAKVRQGLEDWLQEQVLVVQLLGTNGELVSGGRGYTETTVRHIVESYACMMVGSVELFEVTSFSIVDPVVAMEILLERLKVENCCPCFN